MRTQWWSAEEFAEQQYWRAPLYLDLDKKAYKALQLEVARAALAWARLLEPSLLLAR